MRIVKEVMHEGCRITVFYWNNKYLLKFEKGLIEQTYKVPETEIYEQEDLDKIINSELIEKVLQRFDAMQQDLLQALDSLYE